MTQCSTPPPEIQSIGTVSFAGQKIYCGLDVHRTHWSVAVRAGGLQLACTQLACPRSGTCAGLFITWVRKNYPDAEVHSVYEAGFSGFSAHRELRAAGILNIVINPADVPTTGKERTGKSDLVDCRKLAKHLEDGSLTCIHIPTVDEERFRSLVRRESQLRDDSVRESNRIKGTLMNHGLPVPLRLGTGELENLKQQASKSECTHSLYSEELSSHVRELEYLRGERRTVILGERSLLDSLGLTGQALNLMTIPGIAFRTAVCLLAELGDISRFPRKSQLAAFVGIAPHAYGSGSGERDIAGGCRRNSCLCYLLIQSAWVAVSRDRALCAFYLHHRNQCGQTSVRAIKSVAKKLLMIIRGVLKSGQPYDQKRLIETSRAITGQDLAAAGRKLPSLPSEGSDQSDNQEDERQEDEAMEDVGLQATAAAGTAEPAKPAKPAKTACSGPGIESASVDPKHDWLAGLPVRSPYIQDTGVLLRHLALRELFPGPLHNLRSPVLTYHYRIPGLDRLRGHESFNPGIWYAFESHCTVFVMAFDKAGINSYDIWVTVARRQNKCRGAQD